MVNNIGRVLFDLRNERGMSQRELADKSGISNTEISRIEAGKRLRPSPDTLRSFSKALNVEYSDLMKAAGYIEEIHDHDKFYELVFKDAGGNVVDIKRGVKEMFRRDEEWANVAFRVSRELTEDDKEILKDMAVKFLEKNKKSR